MKKNGVLSPEKENKRTYYKTFRIAAILVLSTLFILPAANSQTPATEEIDQSVTYQVTTDGTRLRKKPSLDSEILTHLNLGQRVTLLGKKGEWLKVQTKEGESGWSYYKLLEMQEDQGDTVRTAGEAIVPASAKDETLMLTVKVNTGNVRKLPDVDSERLFTLNRGENVIALQKQDKWYLIQDEDEKTGWAHQMLFYEVKSKQQPDVSVDKEINEIQVAVSPNGDEKISFYLNGFYPPKIMVLEEEIPKVVCDFSDVDLAAAIETTIEVDTPLVREIRTGIHREPF